MNTIELSNVGPKVNTSEIEKFEVDFNISFPVEYKDFLLRNNGGCPKELMFTSDFIEINPSTSEIINQATDVERFFSLSEIIFEYEDIIDENFIPSKYVPIARTSFGNLILVCISTDNKYGGIYFSNHDLFDSKNGCFTISKINDSFVDFIQSLYVDEKK